MPPLKPLQMQVDVSFQFAKVYDVSSFDVVAGQGFTLTTDAVEGIRWFSDQDPLLDILTKTKSAEVTAKQVGRAEILIMDNGLNILKKLNINIVDAIVEPAADLGLSADAPVAK